jgi:integrase
MAELHEHVMKYRDPDGFIFRTPRGLWVHSGIFIDRWNKALKRAGFPKPYPRPHDLRHTAVALMIKAGAHPKQIQSRCGHTSITMTMDTYGHLFPGHDDELVRALEEFRPQEAKVVEL